MRYNTNADRLDVHLKTIVQKTSMCQPAPTSQCSGHMPQELPGLEVRQAPAKPKTLWSHFRAITACAQPGRAAA